MGYDKKKWHQVIVHSEESKACFQIADPTLGIHSLARRSHDHTKLCKDVRRTFRSGTKASQPMIDARPERTMEIV